MRRFHLGYFLREGVINMFSHAFTTFTAIGISVACLLIMGIFSLVAVNIYNTFAGLEDENRILVFIDDTYTEDEARKIGSDISNVENVADCEFVTREEATKSFEARYETEQLLQNLDPSIFRHRYVVRVDDLTKIESTSILLEKVKGVARVRADEEVAKGFVAVKNICGMICLVLVVILLTVSIFIISNAIRLTTFERREEIAIMKMVGATNGFIRWPFVFEGFLMGTLSAALAFGLQWLLYVSVVRSIEMSDVLNMLTLLPFEQIWHYVAIAFASMGIIIGIGGSLSTIHKYLRV